MRELPPEAVTLIQELGAPRRLAAHLLMVHDVAATLIVGLAEAWPGVRFDSQAVLMGAATHDLGKAVYHDELNGPGRRHENDGPALLIEHGLQESHARFARSHGQWAHDPGIQMEDLLVALADTIWKGKRNTRLEDAVVRRLAAASGEAVWETFLKLDDILQAIGDEGNRRLAWELEFEEAEDEED